MNVEIREATVADSQAIARIYNHFVTNTIVTFETAEVTPQEIADRINLVQSGSYPWLAESPCPTKPASRYTKSTVSSKSVTIDRSASSSIDGSTWDIGSECFDSQLHRRGLR
jgi:hypothetical protein